MTNWLDSAVGQYMPGVGTGFFVAVAVHVLSVPTASAGMFRSGDINVRGWSFTPTTASAGIRVVSGAGASVFSPLSDIVAGDIGKILLFVGVLDGAGFVRLYRAGVEVGSGIAIVGYTPATAADTSSIGGLVGGTNSCTWGRIVGTLYGTGVPSAANVLAHYNACKAGNTMESMGGAGVVNVNRWQAKDNIPAAVSWADDLGGMILTKTGTLNSVIFDPTWE